MPPEFVGETQTEYTLNFAVEDDSQILNLYNLGQVIDYEGDSFTVFTDSEEAQVSIDADNFVWLTLDLELLRENGNGNYNIDV